MNRGISLEADGSFDSCVIWDVLSGIDIEGYTWHVDQSQSEVWASFKGDNLFQCDCYSGKDFSQLVKQKYYVIFLKLQGYKGAYRYFNIHTYNDFLKSDCEILMLINDTNFFDLYLKDEELFYVIFNHLKSHGFKNLNYITDENDCRKKMDVR